MKYFKVSDCMFLRMLSYTSTYTEPLTNSLVYSAIKWSIDDSDPNSSMIVKNIYNII